MERKEKGSYYYAIVDGEVRAVLELNSMYDDSMWKSGNYHETREEAEEALKHPKPKSVAEFLEQTIEKKDAVHPSHYKQYPIETIEMMRRIWGNEAIKIWCIMTAFKYRMRMGHKDDIQQELAKEKFYLDYAANLPESKNAEEKIKAIKDAIENICSYEAMFNTIKDIVL